MWQLVYAGVIPLSFGSLEEHMWIMWTAAFLHGENGDAVFGASPEELTQVNRATIMSEPVYKILQIQTQLTAFVNTKEAADVIRWPPMQRSL
jgi:hypothetical protein